MKGCWVLWVGLVVFASCAMEPPPPPVVQQQTASPLAPSTSPTPTTAPRSPVQPTRTPTPLPTETPSLAKRTPVAPATQELSFCRRSFGTASNERFGARLDDIQVQTSEHLVQVTFVFAEVDGWLHGEAGCAWASAWPTTDLGAPQAPGAAFIGLYLDHWFHDDAFAASLALEPPDLAAAAPLQGIAFAAESYWSRGGVIGIGLSEPRPFDVQLGGDRLTVAIASGPDAAYPPSDDLLAQERGVFAVPQRPIFFLQDATVYRLVGEQARPIDAMPGVATALAVSPDGGLLAVCRAAADSDPLIAASGRRATLWSMQADGSDERLLADVGGCAEPAFDADAKRIAFAAPGEASSQIWTVSVAGEEPQPAVAQVDEWSRHSPHWLPDGRLLYRASGDQQAVLFLNDGGSEREISQRLLTGSVYAGIGRFVVDPQRELVAVEALREDNDGADLALLRLDGAQVAVEQRGFWQRPLAFSAAGLTYLTTECQAATVLLYELRQRTAQGRIETLASGSTADAFGATAASGGMLVYVRVSAPALDLQARAEDVLQPEATSTIWAMTHDGARRMKLHEATALITDVVLPAEVQH